MIGIPAESDGMFGPVGARRDPSAAGHSSIPSFLS